MINVKIVLPTKHAKKSGIFQGKIHDDLIVSL